MSLLESMNTAVSGLTAQSAALSAISDNVANSQTVGYKSSNTSFDDYVTQANAQHLLPGVVVARPEYTNTVQGTVTQSTNATSLAISGNGFFAVQVPTGTTTTGATTFNPQTYYTRAGDFTANAQGYLVNSTGYVLDGWPSADTKGTSFNTNATGPIQISTAPSAPVPTTNVSLSANLPSTPTTDTTVTPYTNTVQVYDASGTPQNLTLSWSQVPTSGTGPITTANPAVANEWNLTVTSGTATTGPLLVTFGTQTTGTGASATTTGVPGTITSITAPSTAPAGTVPTAQASGDAATIDVPLNPGSGLGSQSIALKLGAFGTTSGVTQFAGTSYQVTQQAQDGSAQGNYSSVSIETSGNVVVNYDNGASATVAKIPLVNFRNADGLQQQNGQAFTETTESGSASLVNAGTGGTGTLVGSSVENSNVDIASQFTQMIVAQQAYTANSKMITTTNQMMQVTLNMVQA